MSNNVTPNKADPNVIPLKYPFTNAAGQRIETLTLRRAKRADMKAAAKYSKDDAEQEDFLFAQITGLTLEDIDQLDLADSKALTDTFRSMVDN
ncbi:phage tail assembly protein [Ralstonia pseudosolanacearum]|uniref:Phage tail assembly protein n=1 Tax=Ralstonia solanacearum TaxID=305 RepID=A0AA92K1K5_RALSL|nr:phage tail assembly protein [Ralstonia pseudosolanacearum]QOK96816.1 phage tail assembly protein [Ralstonia pseudosolanacearum]